MHTVTSKLGIGYRKGRVLFRVTIYAINQATGELTELRTQQTSVSLADLRDWLKDPTRSHKMFLRQLKGGKGEE